MVIKMNAYKPLMPEREISKRRAWQAKVYQTLRQNRKIRKTIVLDKEIRVTPDVFAPLWGDSILLAKMVRKETKQGDFVLDMETGTGIQAIFAAEKAAKVIAVDINPAAVNCAKQNAKHHGLEEKIEAKESDLFSNISEKFDMIIFNPPFRWFKPRDMLERASLDENYETLNAFFSQVKSYLKENGRILAVFSTSGDIRYFKNLVSESGFKSKILAKEARNSWDYFVYRLTPLQKARADLLMGFFIPTSS